MSGPYSRAWNAAQIAGSAAALFTREIELLRYQVFPHTSKRTIWYKIRMANEMTQSEMADVLDVSVKRYREIEKGNTRANAEVVASLYENLGYCRPSSGGGRSKSVLSESYMESF